MRKHLFWVLGLALAIGISALASASSNTQQFKATISPSKLPKTKYQGVKLHTVTTANSSVKGPLELAPATDVKVYFDNDIKFDTTGIGTCPVTKVQDLDTAGAKKACPTAIVGTGKATAYLAGNTSLPPVTGNITAFNGPKQGGKSTIVLHTRVDSVGLTTALTGVLNKVGGDLGNRLDVTVPPLTGGSALGLFDVTVFKKTGKRQYVSAKCGDKNKTLNYKASFVYDQSNGSAPPKTIKYTQKCKTK